MLYNIIECGWLTSFCFLLRKCTHTLRYMQYYTGIQLGFWLCTITHAFFCLGSTWQLGWSSALNWASSCMRSYKKCIAWSMPWVYVSLCCVQPDFFLVVSVLPPPHPLSLPFLLVLFTQFFLFLLLGWVRRGGGGGKPDWASGTVVFCKVNEHKLLRL